MKAKAYKVERCFDCHAAYLERDVCSSRLWCKKLKRYCQYTDWGIEPDCPLPNYCEIVRQFPLMANTATKLQPKKRRGLLSLLSKSQLTRREDDSSGYRNSGSQLF
jgi:hypothetical protein